MCGIACVVVPPGDRVSAEVMRSMAHVMAHRGPDGCGQFRAENVAMSHVRLAVMDPGQRGDQPMISANRRWALTYNGEVYNFRELREELRKLGWAFSTNTDSEVVMASLAEWGVGAIPRFNGMFALAQWDSETRTLVLARDRYGAKPMYVRQDAGSLAIASEVSALLEYAEGRVRLNRQALTEYFTFQNVLSDETFFDGVKSFPAGHFAVIHTDHPDARIEPQQYWDFRFGAATVHGAYAEIVSESDRLLTQAVERCMVADVEVGAYLSGGIDSATIAAVAATTRVSKSRLKTFTVGFDVRASSSLEVAKDERPEAEAISAFLGTEQFETLVGSGDMERSLAVVVRSIEELRVGQSYPNYFAAKLASAFVKVVLSGVGGDELFGGYPWRYASGLSGTSREGIYRDYFGFWQRMLTDDERASLLRKLESPDNARRPYETFRSIVSGFSGDPEDPRESINLSMYFEAKTFLYGLLSIEDKLSMSQGLEARYPFLDNDLVDFALSIPSSMRIGVMATSTRIDENEGGGKKDRFYDKTHTGKQVLRAVAARHLPRQVSRAAKQGFTGPDSTWFRTGLSTFVMDTLFGPKSRLPDVLDGETMRGLVEEHLSGRKNRRLLIWSLISFEQWLRTYDADV